MSGSSPPHVPLYLSKLTCSISITPQGLPTLSRRPSLLEYPRLCNIDGLWRVSSFDTLNKYRYGTALGDSLNGAGITASWSLAYFLINSRRCLRLRGMHPLSFAIVNLAGLNALIYGSYYFFDADTARRTEV